MNRKIICLLALASYGLMMTSITSCNNNNAHDELAHHHHHHHGEGHEHGEHEEHEDHDHEHEDHEGHEHHEHEGHEGHDHGSGQEITLSPEQAKLLGVEVQTAKLQPFHNSIKVSGEILETAEGSAVAAAPTSGIVTFAGGLTEGKRVGAGALIATVKSTGITGGDPNAAARVAIQNAQREVDRLKPLHEHGIVSTAEYNAALSALASAKAAYSPAASAGRITAPTAGVITQLLVKQGQYVEAGSPIATISSTRKLTLRADVPQRYYGELATLTGAKVKTPYASEVMDIAALGGTRVVNSEATRARGGYIPVYYTFNNNGALMPGSAVEVYLQGAGRGQAIVVPVSALSEQQGNYFVYIKVDDEGYIKSPVTTGVSDGENIEILKGVHPGDNVVVKGTTTVRLAETSNVVPEGHTHNH